MPPRDPGALALRRLDELPPTLHTDQAADLFGISSDLLYELNQRGEAPVEPLRLGRRLRWPTAPILAVLGIEHGAAPETGTLRSVDGSGGP